MQLETHSLLRSLTHSHPHSRSFSLSLSLLHLKSSCMYNLNSLLLNFIPTSVERQELMRHSRPLDTHLLSWVTNLNGQTMIATASIRNPERHPPTAEAVVILAFTGSRELILKENCHLKISLKCFLETWLVQVEKWGGIWWLALHVSTLMHILSLSLIDRSWIS